MLIDRNFYCNNHEKPIGTTRRKTNEHTSISSLRNYATFEQYQSN
jgi:hypothetical protein